MVMTHTDDQSEAPHKTEIDSLHSQDGYSGDDASNSPPDFGTVSANQPIENEFVIIDGAEFEMRDDSHAPKAKRLKSIVPVTPFVTARTPHGHSLDIFFRAMCATVKTFPSADMAEIKLQISQIVGKKEIEIMNRPQTWEYKFLHRFFFCCCLFLNCVYSSSSVLYSSQSTVSRFRSLKYCPNWTGMLINFRIFARNCFHVHWS